MSSSAQCSEHLPLVSVEMVSLDCVHADELAARRTPTTHQIQATLYVDQIGVAAWHCESG